MIFGLLYFCVVILCVNRSRTSFILYRIVKRHSRQSNVRRIWTCADSAFFYFKIVFNSLIFYNPNHFLPLKIRKRRERKENKSTSFSSKFLDQLSLKQQTDKTENV